MWKHVDFWGRFEASFFDDGPLLIPASFILNWSENLVKPILILFNSSLLFGVFPKVWKSCFTKAIHKDGSLNNVKNYRPIATINALAKLFDAIVAWKLFIATKSVITVKQQGLMPLRSTESNLALFTSYISDSFELDVQIDTFYSNFSRVFDSVNHKLLIRNLKNIGGNGTILQWIKSHLHGRTDQVKIKNLS